MSTSVLEQGSPSGWESQPTLVRPQRKHRGNSGSRWMAGVLSVALVLALATVGFGYYYFIGSAEPVQNLLTTKVKKGKLVITVTEDGNVESASNVELKCEVAGSTTILEIIQDGKHVKKGDELVRFDSSTIDDSINQQRITSAKAESTKITAENDWSAAKIAVNQYLEGTFVTEMLTAESNITIALENLRSAENILEHTKRMARKGYVTPLQLESQEFAVKRANLEVKQKEQIKDELERFTKQKMVEELTSKRDSAEARTKSEVAAYDLELGKLKRLENQMNKSTIKAPQDGMVVYANDMNASRFGAQGPKIEQGAAVREYQAILRLPDLANMQVKVLVHETKVDRLRIGMPANVKIQDREYHGKVVSIGNQAELGAWWASNAKEYGTVVKIDGQPADLKPGMTAQVEILVEEKDDVLTVPVQCVVEAGGKFYAWVKTPTGTARRELVLGGTDDKVIEVKDGLKVDDLVLQNPRADIPEAREDVPATEGVDTKSKFGGSALKADDTAKPGAGPGTGVGPGAGAGGPPMAGGPGAGAPGAGAPGAGGAAAMGGGGPGGGGPGGGGGGGRRMMTFEEMDKDSDGKLSKEDYPEQARGFFDMIDTNKDGFVDKAESEAVMKRMREMRQQGGGGFGGPGGGAPGGGAPAAGPGAGG